MQSVPTWLIGLWFPVLHMCEGNLEKHAGAGNSALAKCSMWISIPRNVMLHRYKVINYSTGSQLILYQPHLKLLLFNCMPPLYPTPRVLPCYNMWYLYELGPSKSVVAMESSVEELLKGLLVLACYKGILDSPRPRGERRWSAELTERVYCVTHSILQRIGSWEITTVDL